MRKLLFQGDSITDCGRIKTQIDRHLTGALGSGYVSYLAGEIYLAGKGSHIINKGVAGDCLGDMQHRWHQDTMDFTPDILTVLIGINDTWQRSTGGMGQAPIDYIVTLEQLLLYTKRELPQLKIVLMENFFLPLGVANNNWREEVLTKNKLLGELADKHDWKLVPLQNQFDKQATKFKESDFLYDGVHPTPAGHRLIADQWLSHCSDIYSFTNSDE